MGSTVNLKTWVPIPYTNIKDCSQGFCTLYCPQWCYIVFPPPPPVAFFPDHNSDLKLSPLVIAIIGILASAFLLVSYYSLISKYCGSSNAETRRRIGEHDSDTGSRFNDHHDPSVHEAWQVETIGLDESVIRSITVCKYKKGVGLIEGTCSVCLSEFEEEESIRLLPKCTHAFHIPCIDTWLKSHSSCPLCRSEIVFVSVSPIALPPLQEREIPPPISGSTANGREVNHDGKEEEITAVENPSGKLPLRISSDLGNVTHTIIEIEEEGIQRIRRSASMDHPGEARVLALDLIGVNQNEITRAGHLDGGGSSQNPSGELSMIGQKRKLLDCLKAPMNMKRSFPNERSPLGGRGALRGVTIPA